MKKTISIILIAVFAAVLGSSTFYIVRHNKEADKQAELYHNLASVVEAAAQTDAEAEPTEPIPYSEEKTILPELAELFGQNGDLVGWISIADTNINYPVMQSVNEPNFYLKHGFDKEYSEYGCPYVQEDCDVQKPSDNLAIYGHHMKNGSMFAHLDKFKSESFWSEHKTIAFNTLTDRQEYEIVAVFRTVVYTDSPDAFMLEQLRTVNQADLLEYIGRIDDEHCMKKINIGVKKALGLWVDKPYRKPADMRCLCVKCLESYKNSPNYIVKRLDPFAKAKDKCDKCQSYGYDYLVIERSKEG